MKKLSVYAVFIWLLLLILPACANAEDGTMTLPSAMKIIEREAFYGVSTLDKVVIPEGATEIHSLAFVGCSLTEVVLPSTLTYIADDAFDASIVVSVPDNCYAYFRCIELGFIEQPAIPTTPETSFTYDVIGDAECVVTGYSGAAIDIVIPETLGGYVVKAIGEAAFANCGSLRSVTIPYGVTEIGYGAFYECSSLKTIEIPSSVTTIDEGAFYNCNSLQQVSIPDGVSVIAEIMFYGCTNLRHVNIPDSVMTIDNGAFGYCSSLIDVEIPYGVTYLAENVFYGCSSLTNILIPHSVTSIGSSAFAYCSSLTNITLPKSVISIGATAFAGCSNLKSIELPSSMVVIPEGMFFECSNLASVIIPNSVTEIGYGAFAYCSSLTAIELPQHLEDMAHTTFSHCTSLKHITIPDGVTVIGPNTFEGCVSLTEVNLPAGLLEIHHAAFANCDGLVSIHLPDTITCLGSGAFINCDNLVHVNFPRNWNTVDTYNSYNVETPFQLCLSLSRISIPEGVTTIPEYAFSAYCYASSFQLPRTLKTIGAWAFFGNKGNLERLIIPEGVTTIGAGAFSECYQLKDVYIPASVISIADSSFLRCPATIWGMAGSYAETYAREHNISFSLVPSLEVTLNVSANSTTAGGNLTAMVSTTNGTGSNKYQFTLYKNGSLYQQTQYSSKSSQSFAIGDAGSYQIVVHVRDYVGASGTADSGTVVFKDAETTTISGRVLDEMGNPVEGVTVSIKQDTTTSTFMLISRSVDLAGIVVTDANGRWSWDQAIPGATYMISASKDGLTFESVISVVVDSIWGVVVEPLYALGLGFTTNAAESSLSGTILTADGMAVQGVSVIVTETDGTRVANVTTDVNGTWGISGLKNDTEYTVTYGENQMTVEPANETVTLSGGSVSLTAIAELISGEASDVVTFTMSENSIVVGHSATFVVHVPTDVTKARLVVDGNAYDVIYPVDGTCTYTRAFTQSGNRAISFQIAKDGVWADISAVQNLSVTSNGQLDAPVYTDIIDHYTGTALTIDWNDVTNAQRYVVWLYHDKVPVNHFDTTASIYTIPANEFSTAGNYSVSVIATGNGYDQTATDDTFIVVARDYAFTLQSPQNGYTYVVGDQVDMMLTQTGGGYLTVKVVDPSGKTTWYPQTEAGLTGDMSVWLPFTVNEVGTYTVTPYLYTVNELTPNSQPYLIGKTTAFVVNGPSIHGIYPAGGSYTWVYSGEADMVRIKTNNAAESITIYEGETLLANTVEYIEENYIRTFTVSLPVKLSKGLHTMTVKGGDQDSNAVASKDYSFYVVNSIVNGGKVYPQDNQVKLYSSPLNGKHVATANGGTTVDRLTIIGDAGSWYMVKTADGTEGFVPYEQVADHAWEGASGSIVITCPPEGVSLPCSVYQQLLFTWESGLVLPEDTVYTLTISSLVNQTKIEVESSTCEAPVPMSKLPQDQYTAIVTAQADGKVLASSAPVSFTMGNFNLEDAYRQWWQETIAPQLKAYMTNEQPFNGKVTDIWGNVKVQIVNGEKPTVIREAAELAYTQILEDFDDFARDSRTSAANNWAIVQIDPDALRRECLVVIGRAMLNDKQKIKLQEDLSNVSGIAKVNQTATIREARLGVIKSTANALFSGFELAIQGGGIASGSSAGNTTVEFTNKIQNALNQAVSIVEEMYEEEALIMLLSAYADEYATMLSAACAEYVKYLKDTYVETEYGFNGQYSKYVQEYIDAFEAVQNDPDKLYEEALKAILKGTGYSPEDLEEIQNASDAEVLLDIGMDMLFEAVTRWLNDQINTMLAEAGISGFDLFVWNTETNLPEIRYDALKEHVKKVIKDEVDAYLERLLKDLLKSFVKKEYMASIRANIRGALNEEFKVPDGHVSMAETFMKGELIQIENQQGLIQTAYDIAISSWDFGFALGELVMDSTTLIEQGNNKGVFDTEGLDLIATLKMRMDACHAGGGYLRTDWVNADLSRYAVEDLEKLRKMMVTLTLYDEMIMTHYGKMYTINVNNNWKFDYGLTWLAPHGQQLRINDIKKCRELVENRPAVFDSLFPE